jgi:uncharacterized Tic20 family protein
MIVAIVSVFGPIPIAMFLSQSRDFLDILYYEMDASPFSSVIFYYVISLVVILIVVLMAMICSSSITCCYLSYKIRFETPESEGVREIA